jgi:hypothetical protein
MSRQNKGIGQQNYLSGPSKTLFAQEKMNVFTTYETPGSKI